MFVVVLEELLWLLLFGAGLAERLVLEGLLLVEWLKSGDFLFDALVSEVLFLDSFSLVSFDSLGSFPSLSPLDSRGSFSFLVEFETGSNSCTDVLILLFNLFNLFCGASSKITVSASESSLLSRADFLEDDEEDDNEEEKEGDEDEDELVLLEVWHELLWVPLALLLLLSLLYDLLGEEDREKGLDD